MALLLGRRTLTDNSMEDVLVTDTVNEDSLSPVHSLEVIGIQGRVQEMVLRFSMCSNGESLKITDRSPPGSTGVSPTQNGSTGRSWRSASPVYNAYRTGWLPSSKPASHMTAASPQSQQHAPRHYQPPGDSSPSAVYSSRLDFSLSTPDQPLPSLNTVSDVTSQSVSSVKDHSTQVVTSDRHATGSMVNGSSGEYEVSQDHCDGQPVSADKSDCFPSSLLVDHAPPLPRSSLELSETLGTSLVEAPPTITNGCNGSVSSVELSAPEEKNDPIISDHRPRPSSEVSVVGNAGKDSEHEDHNVAPPCGSVLEGPQTDEVCSSTDPTRQITEHLHSTGDNDVEPPDDSTVTSLPAQVHRDSNLLLSARRTSIDYFQKDGRYFLQLVQSVEDRINALCDKAEADMNCTVPEEVLGKLRAAVGKAHLLTSKKFKQFRELCNKNLTQDSAEQFRTTSQDLAGFWDLVMIQIDDVRLMFAEIEELRQNAWKELAPAKNVDAPLSPTARHTRSSASPLSAGKHSSIKSKTGHSRDSTVKSDAVKAREEARKRLLAAKAAGRQRKASENDASDVQIFVS